MSFEKSINRLEEICKILQSGNLSLDDSLSLFEEGTKLIEDCNKVLNEAEQKVTVIHPDGSEEEFNNEN